MAARLAGAVTGAAPRARFHGWVIVTGAFLVFFVAYGAQYAFGVFFTALLDEFKWSRAALAGVFSVYACGYCLFGFPAGRLTDRWGPRVVVTVGGLLLGGALIAMGSVTSLWHIYLLYGGVAAIGMGTAYVPCNTTVVRWFVRRRGLAVGIASSGASAGTLVAPPLAHLLVSTIGWRGAYVVFGLVVVVVLTLIARVMRRDPESMGQFPDGDDRPPPLAEGSGPEWRLAAALRSRSFWLLGAAFTATWVPVFIPLVHAVSFARDLGFSSAVGASVVSVLGVGAVVGRLVMGVVSDRIGRQATIALGIVLQAVAFVGLATVQSLAVLYLVALLFGYSYGAIATLFPAIVGDFFGRKQAGSLFGFLFALAGSISGVGPFAAGAIYDARGSYVLAYQLGAACNVLAFALLMVSRRPAAAGP